MTLPLFPSYREISLSQGQIAIVDESDYEILRRHKWHAVWCEYTHSFYAQTWLYVPYKRREFMHRIVMECEKRDGKQIDHINGQTTDNRRSNLRFVTHSQNQMNRKLHSAISASGHRGVSWCKITNKWKVRVNVDGKEIWLGRHTDKQVAINIAKSALVENFGEYARTS